MSLAGGVPPNMNGKLLLTSKTYNKIIESNPNVCSYHRQIRKAEREWIRSAVKNSRSKWWTFSPVKQVPKSKDNFDVFDYISSSSELVRILFYLEKEIKRRWNTTEICIR